MQNGKNIGLQVISCENKISTDALTELQHKANSIIFQFSWKFLSPKLASQIAVRLTKIGEEINDLEIKNPKAEPKRKEILQALRTIIPSLKRYAKDYEVAPEDKQQTQKVFNASVAQYIKDKEEKKFTEKKILESLKLNKTLWQGYDLEGIKTDSFVKMQEELLEMLTEKYKLQ